MRICKLTALVVLIALTVSFNSFPVEALADFNRSIVKQEIKIPLTDWSCLLINDNEIKREDAIIREKSGESYIFINADIFKDTFKYPYLSNIYPDLYREGDTFTVTWSDNTEPRLNIIMQVDNPIFTVNGKSFDAGMGPIQISEAFYIPINSFIVALDMRLEQDLEAGTITVQHRTDFAKDILVGYWSDVNINLFIEFKDPATGAKSLASCANAYIYNADGTYRLRMLSVGDFKDSFLEQCGKYKILGNTILHYDISETLYKGNPFVLQYRNKPLDKPIYSFIDNYYPDLKKIVIDQIPVMKNCQ